jgi:hypothetical protein
VGRRNRTVDVDATASLLDHNWLKARPAGILRRVADAEIEGQSDEEQGLPAAFARIAGEPSRGFVVVS